MLIATHYQHVCSSPLAKTIIRHADTFLVHTSRFSTPATAEPPLSRHYGYCFSGNTRNARRRLLSPTSGIPAHAIAVHAASPSTPGFFQVMQTESPFRPVPSR